MTMLSDFLAFSLASKKKTMLSNADFRVFSLKNWKLIESISHRLMINKIRTMSDRFTFGIKSQNDEQLSSRPESTSQTAGNSFAKRHN